jgi:polygalacturonase
MRRPPPFPGRHRSVQEFRGDVRSLAAQAPVVPAKGNRPAYPLDVTTFGALGDGTDDTAAFQKALDAARDGGHAVVNVPAGT